MPNVSEHITAAKNAVLLAIANSIGLSNMTQTDWNEVNALDALGHDLLERMLFADQTAKPPADNGPWTGPAFEEQAPFPQGPAPAPAPLSTSAPVGKLDAFFSAAREAGDDMSGNEPAPVSPIVEADAAPKLNTDDTPPPDYTALERASRLDSEVRAGIER